MLKLVRFCVNNPKKTIFFFIILTILWGYKASSVTMDSDIFNIIPKDENSTESSAYLIMGLETKNNQNLYTIEGLEALYKVISNISEFDEVLSSHSIFSIQTPNTGENGRLITSSPLPLGLYPKNNIELETFTKNVVNNPFLENTLICNDGKLINTIFTTIKTTENKDSFLSRIQKATKPLENYYNVSFAGDLILGERANFYLEKDFITLLIGALFIMLVIFFFSFRARRAIFLPIALVLVGVIWALGLMGLLGFKITVVSCVVPALVLTIGNSYTIHVINELFRNSHENSFSKDWISKAVLHINNTIIIASLTTVVGFLSLLFTNQGIMKEFAISISFGILSVAILSLFLLPAIFSLLNKPSDLHSHKANKGKTVTLLGHLGFIVTKHYKLFLLLSVIFISISILILPKLRVGSDYYNYFPKNDLIIQENLELFKKNGGINLLHITLTSDTAEYFTSNEGLKLLDKLDTYFISNTSIYSIDSMITYYKKINLIRYNNYELPTNRGLLQLLKRQFANLSSSDNIFSNSNFISSNGDEVTFYLRIYNTVHNSVISEPDFVAFLQPLKDDINKITNNDVSLKVGGPAYLGNTVTSILLKDQKTTLIISFILVFIISCLYFKSFYYGIMSILPLISAVTFNFTMMILLRIPLDVTTMMVSSVAIGVGIDDAIHLLIQFKKQKRKFPNNINRVMYNTYRITGRPILLTTLSIVSGMLVLILANFVPIKYFGVLVAFSLSGALFGTLFFLPSMLVMLYKILHFCKKIS
ncbi:MAG: MMPL family transporter [Spirochaetales bacterium]|nr:MMPL family transporter [Spirochaetales bacterium]